MAIKQKNAIFTISRSYTDPNKGMCQASVQLEIDFLNNSYNIMNHLGNYKFVFHNTSYNNAMWIAVLDCIYEAIEFANNVLTDKEKNNG